MNMFTKKISNCYLYIFSFIIISFFLLLPLLHSNFYISHDGEAHVARFAAYSMAFQDGQLPPRWAGNLNSKYGSPLFIFFYPLPVYFASFLHLLGFDFEVIYKIIMFFTFILSPIFLFVWLKSFTKIRVAYVASFAFLVLPYRFLDTLVRGDIAEMLSFIFIPLVFLYLDKANENDNIVPVVIGGTIYAFLILSRNAIAFIFTPVFIVYSFALDNECFSRELN